MKVPQQVDHDHEDALVPVIQQEDTRRIMSSRMKDVIILMQSFLLLVIAY
jgi:hypothetical protein